MGTVNIESKSYLRSVTLVVSATRKDSALHSRVGC
jgi:hypothetical protein